MKTIPRAIPGSKTALSDDITVSILIDRAMLVEIGKHMLMLLSSEEAAALLAYLTKHQYKFTNLKGGNS